MKLLSTRHKLLGCIVANLYLYARFIEPQRPVIERITLPFADYAHLRGLRIVQLSDFHVGATHMGVIHKVVEIVKGLDPDLILLTGDYVDHPARHSFDLARALTTLKPQHGIFAVMGNHDIYTNAPDHCTIITHALEYYGIPVLGNKHVVLSNGLVIAGLNEPVYGKPDLFQALRGVGADSPVILLVHRPDFADNFCVDGRIDVQLSGHTHGGQINIPGFGPLYLPGFGRKYTQGLYRVGQMHLYVNRGIGVSTRLKMRFNVPPEITLFTCGQR